MSKHTSGPWEAGRKGYGSPFAVYSDDKTGSAICQCQLEYVARTSDEMKANASLIAAAPDMLGALKQASFCLRELLPEDKDALYTLDIINKALAKAEGRQL